MAVMDEDFQCSGDCHGLLFDLETMSASQGQKLDMLME